MDRTQRVRWMPPKPDTRWSHHSGEPCAVKVACTVREEAVGNVPRGNALAAYFIWKASPHMARAELPKSQLCDLA
jgi:hypothetical protein